MLKCKKNVIKKTFLIFLVWGTLFSTSNLFSQSQIQNKATNLTLQLDFICKTYDIAIKKIALRNRRDTITSANINIKYFLVYNTAKRKDISPGYYYWYGKKWNNLKNIFRDNGLPMRKGNAGDVFVDSSTRDVYLHNGTMWITKIINDQELTQVKFNSTLGLLTYKNGTDKDDYINLSRVEKSFGENSCISMNATRKTINYIDDKGLFVILDLKLLKDKKNRNPYNKTQ